MLGKRESLSSQLKTRLGKKIREGAYKPGDRIPTEGELCAEYGVSRTVVREAVASLRADGLVMPRQGVGVFVNEIIPLQPFSISTPPCNDVDDLAHILELRLGVELEAAALAARRRTAAQLREIRSAFDRIDAAARPEGVGAGQLDFDLHLAIARASNNPYFETFLQFLGAQIIPRLRFDAVEDDLLRARWRRNHAQIVTAIAAQREDAARQAMRAHLSESLSRHRDSRPAE